MARRLDETARAVLRNWLLRGLDDEQVPPRAELAERLGDSGIQLRVRVISHAEAIAGEGILSPDQARRWRPGYPPAGRLMDGRYALFSAALNTPPKTAFDADSMIRATAAQLIEGRFPASQIFGIIVTRDGGLAGLTIEEARLARDLDELARAACRNCFLRGMGDPPPPGLDPEPPTEDQADRLTGAGLRLRASVVAHAESIALLAVLRPDHSESALRQFWRRTGVESLLDPELASRLRLSRHQQEEVLAGLANRAMVVRQTSSIRG